MCRNHMLGAVRAFGRTRATAAGTEVTVDVRRPATTFTIIVAGTDSEILAQFSAHAQDCRSRTHSHPACVKDAVPQRNRHELGEGQGK